MAGGFNCSTEMAEPQVTQYCVTILCNFHAVDSSKESSLSLQNPRYKVVLLATHRQPLLFQDI